MPLPKLPPVPQLTKAGFADPVWARWIDQLRLYISQAIVTLTINTANGFAGSVTQTQGSAQITLSVTASGLLKGQSGAIVAAVPGTDYVQSVSVTAPIVNSGTAANPNISHAASGVIAGTYTKVTVEADGHVTNGSFISQSDVDAALGYAPLNPANNLSDVANATTARGNLSAAKSGVNTDITSLGGLLVPLSIAQGGTGSNTSGGARTNLGAAGSGANTDITSLSANALLTGTAGVAAPTGFVGELLLGTGSAVSLVSGTPKDLATIALTAGNWIVWGNAQYIPAAGTTQSFFSTGISQTANTLPASPFGALEQITVGVGLSQTQQAPMIPIVITGPATVRIVGAAVFSGGTETANAFVYALRFH